MQSRTRMVVLGWWHFPRAIPLVCGLQAPFEYLGGGVFCIGFSHCLHPRLPTAKASRALPFLPNPG